MFNHGIKTNILVNLAVLLVLAMILIDLVVTVTAQRVILESELSKGYLLISTIENSLVKSSESKNNLFKISHKNNFDQTLQDAGFSCIQVLDKNKNHIYQNGLHCVLKEELELQTWKAIRSGEKTAGFFGTTWGVFWKQHQYLIVSAPLLKDGRIIGGAGIIFQLKKIYKILIDNFWYI